MLGLSRGELVDSALDLAAAVVGRAADAWDRFTAPWRAVRISVRFPEPDVDRNLRDLLASIKEAQRLQDRKTSAAIRVEAVKAGIGSAHVDFAIHLYAQLVREVGEAMIVEPPVFFASLRADRAYLFEDAPVGHVPGTP